MMTPLKEILGTKLRVAGFACLGTVAADRLAHVLSQIVGLVSNETFEASRPQYMGYLYEGEPKGRKTVFWEREEV